MTSLVLAGNTSGTLTINAPDVAATSVLNLPASSGTILDDASVGVCRAWVNFNGTGTVAIRASFNVSGITDNGTGDYTVNFTTAMVDANYTTITATSNTATNSTILVIDNATPPTTSSVKLLAFNSSIGSFVDEAFNSVAIFR
jgi:hypothetical protein